MTSRKVREAKIKVDAINVAHVKRLLNYMENNGKNKSHIAELSLLANFPFQSVFMTKAVFGSYTSAFGMLNRVFPECEFTIDQDGASITVDEYEASFDGNPCECLVMCILDAIIHVREHGE